MISCSVNTCQTSMQLADSYSYIQDSAPAHWARETLQFLSTNAPDFSLLLWLSLISIQSTLRCADCGVLQWCIYHTIMWDAFHLKQCRMDEWNQFNQHIIVWVLSFDTGSFNCMHISLLRGSCWPPLRQTGEDNWVVPTSHGSAPFNRIWNITILRSPKQQIWLRTALCGGWCWHMALRNRELHARNDDDDDISLPSAVRWSTNV